MIIDEAQRAPALFSYIQTKVDELDHPGQYVLTGSAQFPLIESVAQSLAGRAAILKLLPLSIDEVSQHQEITKDWEQQLFKVFIHGFINIKLIHKIGTQIIFKPILRKMCVKC